MTTVFKVGDVVRLKYDTDAPGRRVVTRIEVENDLVHYEVQGTCQTQVWPAPPRLLELVSRAAPPPFASCTDPGTPPACANEVPKPTRLEEARRHVYAQGLCVGRRMDELLDELIDAAKAEAIAEREAAKRKRYGEVIGTVSASYCPDTTHFIGSAGGAIQTTFSITVPSDHPIATAPFDRVNYWVTATSKGER